MNRRVMRAVWVIAFSVAVQHSAGAGIPQLIAYQGRLTGADGTSLIGDHTVRFRLYDAESGGSTVWEEEHRVTLATQDNGVFSTMLGSLKAFGTLQFNQPLWLSLEVDGEGEMAPRLRLTAVGYAINADTLDGLKASQLLRADVDTEAKGQLKVASVHFGSDANDDLVASDVATLTGGASSVADALHTHSSGSGLTELNASNLASGTVPDARLSSTVSLLGASIESAELTDGTITAMDLGTDSVGADQLRSDAIQSGDIEAGDLPSLGRASTSDSSSVDIGTSDTTLLSVAVNKVRADSTLLIVASVSLSTGSSGGSKTVAVKLDRGGTTLDGSYSATIGGGDAEAVTLHGWDAAGSGTHTVTLKASADKTGVTATVRRLTVVEVP